MVNITNSQENHNSPISTTIPADPPIIPIGTRHTFSQSLPSDTQFSTGDNDIANIMEEIDTLTNLDNDTSDEVTNYSPKAYNTFSTLSSDNHHRISFHIDSGCDAHMCNNISFFQHVTYQKQIPTVVLADDKTTLPCKGMGPIDFCFDNGKRIVIHNVLYVPTLKESLFSTNTFTQDDKVSISVSYTHLTLPTTPYV